MKWLAELIRLVLRLLWYFSEDGVKHSRIIMVATKFYECPDKEETPAEEPAKPATKKGKK